MASFSRFEDIKAWQGAREVTVEIYRISATGNFSKDFGLKDQTRRAAVSIMANIAEGHGGRTNVEFANFLNFAPGSAAEVQSHLYVAEELGYIDSNQFKKIYDRLTEISRMTLSLARYLRDSRRSDR